MTNVAHMPHVTHYKCVSTHDLNDLQTEVETEIHGGWQPYGPLLAVGAGTELRFVQPMVQYVDFYR